MREQLHTTSGKVESTDQVYFMEPADLYQPEPNACVSCVTANVMYMFGKMEQPDINTVDTELGRQPGEPLVFNTAYLHLLRQGFSMHFLDAFDEEDFINRGLPYLKEFYKDSWTGPSFDEHWTPDKVDERRQARKESRDEFNAHGSKFVSEAKTPTIEDIDNFLRDKQVVLIKVTGSRPGMTHAAMIYGKNDDDTYKLYQPKLANSDPYDVTLLVAARSYLDSEFVPSEGVVGISLK